MVYVEAGDSGEVGGRRGHAVPLDDTMYIGGGGRRGCVLNLAERTAGEAGEAVGGD